MMDDQSQTDQLSFTGKSKTECQQFIREVRRLAFKAGKSRDDEWMADLAAASMMDEAIEWHISLDDAVQGSWALLQKALSEKYFNGADSLSNSTIFVSLQVPAAARVGNPASGPPPALVAPNVATRTGNIALIDSASSVEIVAGSSSRWMTGELGPTGMLRWTPMKSSAVLVRCSPSSGGDGVPHDIHLVNSARSPAYLAFTSIKVPDRAGDHHASVHDAALTLAGSGFDAGSVSSSYLLWDVGYTTSTIWSIDSHGIITAKVTGTPPRSEFVVNTQSGNIYAPLSISEWKRRFPSQAANLVVMKMVFMDL